MQNKRHHNITQTFKKSIGICFDDYGRPIINANLFIKHFLTLHDIVVSDGTRFYIWLNRHVWSEVTVFDIKRKLRNLLHSYERDIWSIGIEHSLMAVLPLACAKAESLKSSVNKINVRNGLIDLGTFELEPHDRNVFSTLQLPIDYDSKAKCPDFQEFLEQVFMGDKQLIRLTQEWMGYAISPGVEAQKFLILYSDGASGKSTLCDILFALAGGYKNVSCVALGDLGKRFQRSQLVDKVLNLSTESDVSGAMDTQALKAIVSGDPLQIERKGQDPFTYRGNVKIVAAVNHLPYPRDKSYAFTRRLVIIPFLRRFVDEPKAEHEAKIDREMMSRLLPELPGILNFALKGLKRLKKNDYRFTESERASEVLASYIRDVNPILDFEKVCIVSADKERVSTNAVYAAFRNWCYDNGHSRSVSFTKRRFLHEFRVLLRSEGVVYDERKSNGKKYFYGIAFSKTGKAYVPREQAEPILVSSIDDLCS
jgi:putative DNA primase/helicase